MVRYTKASDMNFKQTSEVNGTKRSKYKWEIVWPQVLHMLIVHIGGLYGFYQFCFVCSWKTCLWTYLGIFLSGQGITAGAHRLWTHRSYKAKLPLRIILMILQSMAFQTHIYGWVRNHRVHHKFTDTDADPHNATRGFFFSHVGWVMMRKHPDVAIKGKTVDMIDVEADPVVQFQKKYYGILVIITSFLIPTFIPWYFWNESIWVSWFTAGMFRHCASLQFTFFVNSIAHRWGTKPYDITIGAAENKLISFLTYGEGWHNYHHVFPWDYKTGELSSYRLNQTTLLIDLFAKIGWAYDLKTTSIDMVEKRATRTGDGSRKCCVDQYFVSGALNNDGLENIWGWGDGDMKLEDIEGVKVYNQLKEVKENMKL